MQSLPVAPQVLVSRSGERLAAEGARISVWDISESALASLDPTFAHRISMDQSDESAVAAGLRLHTSREEFGQIDILIVCCPALLAR